jgi:hypothetical protein
MEYCIALSGARIVFADDERVERLLPHVPALKEAGMTHMVCNKNDMGKSWQGVMQWSEVMSKYPAWSKTELPSVEIHPDDEATLLFTRFVSA